MGMDGSEVEIYKKETILSDSNNDNGADTAKPGHRSPSQAENEFPPQVGVICIWLAFEKAGMETMPFPMGSV